MKIFRFLLVIFISLFFGTNSNNHSSVHLHKISNPQNDTSCLSFEKSKDEFIENNGYNANIVASNIKEIAAISFDVIYDKTVVSVSNTNNYLQSDATSMYDDKIDNDNGAIHVSYIFSDNKNIVDEIIFGFDFKILNSEKENSYFSLSIVSAIDENGDAQTLKGDFYYFNIREEIQQNYVEIYSDLERSKAESGEEFTINYYSFSFSNIGAGCFEFKYDKNYFELLSVEKGDFLNDTSIFSTINKEYLGYVKISFASNDIKDNDGKNLFKIRLKTIIKEGIKTNIVMSSYELYSSDGMTQYYAKDVNNNIETCETSMPKMFLNAVTDEVNKKLYLTLSLDRDSHLAAADIEIEFEYKVLKYASYDILYKLQNNPMFGVNDKDINKGILKINWVYLEDLTENVDFCKLTFDILDIRQEKTTNINLKVTGARDLNLDEIVILPKGCNVSLSPNYHEWTSWGIIDSANCIKNGKEARTCIFCGIVEERTIEKNDNHNYSDWIIDKEPTCLEKGSRHKMCSLCKNEIIEDIDALGHDLVHYDYLAPTCDRPGHNEYDECRRCNYTTFKEIPATNEHNFVVFSVEEATCISEGKIIYRCSNCGLFDDSKNKVIPCKPHNYSDWTITVEPTCIQEGLKQKTCSYCGKVVTETIDKIEHNYMYYDGKAPTCTEAGFASYRACTICGDSTYKELSALGHELVKHIEEASCVEDGKISYICSRCGYIDRTEIIPSPGHNYGEWIIDKNVTCMEAGLRHKTCSTCGDKFYEEFYDSTAHDYVHYEAKDPTCTEPGHKAYDECSICKYSTYEEIPPLGHDFIKHTEEATCTKDGKITYECSRCGYIDESKTEIITSHGHNYGDWIIDKEATCLEFGLKHKTCSTCGDVLYEEIADPTAHDYVYHEGKEPTCTESGFKAYETCTRCSFSTYEEIPPLGHDFVKHTEEATCTKDGKITYECSRCGYIDESKTEIITSHGHNYGDWIIDQEATCTKEGSKHKTCSTCGTQITEKIDPLGHDLIHHEGKEPTCTESGYKAYDECSRCEYSTYEEIPPLGHDFIKHTEEATCTKDGKITYECSKCGYIDESKTEIIPSHGHNYGDWIKDNGKTNTEIRTCTICGHSESRTVENLNSLKVILGTIIPILCLTIVIAIIVVTLYVKRKHK